MEPDPVPSLPPYLIVVNHLNPAYRPMKRPHGDMDKGQALQSDGLGSTLTFPVSQSPTSVKHRGQYSTHITDLLCGLMGDYWASAQQGACTWQVIT